MLFNSIEFGVFLPLLFVLYWFVTHQNLKLQNLLLLIASYVFYGWWDWRFLLLIIFSSSLDYFIGLQLSKTEKAAPRKRWLLTSIFVNLGFLFFFKYYNFFIESFVESFSFFGAKSSIQTLNIILPVGISFYTFQTLSYTIDVYQKKLKPTQDILAFFAFVSFFPQLVAGPIERASNLLPQFYHKRKFDQFQAIDGMRQILWGLFKKIVIADNCAVYVNEIFNNQEDYGGMILLLGGVLFMLQIYGDFSGYSDVAIGVSRLFGFRLMKNFAFPFFSLDVAEFWRRWHISLSTWFRDYLYIPLGGSKRGKQIGIRNMFIIFIVSGFWHGANWTFIVWGCLNALFIAPLFISNHNRHHLDIVAAGKVLPSLKEFFQMALTFLLLTITFIIFRADSVSVAFEMIYKIFFDFKTSVLELRSVANSFQTTMTHACYIIGFMLIEWLQRHREHALHLDELRMPRIVRWGIYYTVLFSIFFVHGHQQDFIYFQF